MTTESTTVGAVPQVRQVAEPRLEESPEVGGECRVGRPDGVARSPAAARAVPARTAAATPDPGPCAAAPPACAVRPVRPVRVAAPSGSPGPDVLTPPSGRSVVSHADSVDPGCHTTRSPSAPPIASGLMTVAASTTLFAVVFGLFVVAALVLLVLTLRFVVGQAKRSKAQWLADRSAAPRTTPETRTTRRRTRA